MLRNSNLKIVGQVGRPAPIKRVFADRRPAAAPKPPPVASGHIDPAHLHDLLPIAATKIITFANEKALQNYRAMLYRINGQGDFRYRTIRDELSMWGIIIWRMK